MISAPMAPSRLVAIGPATTQLKSTTRIPDRQSFVVPAAGVKSDMNMLRLIIGALKILFVERRKRAPPAVLQSSPAARPHAEREPRHRDIARATRSQCVEELPREKLIVTDEIGGRADRETGDAYRLCLAENFVRFLR